MAVTMKIYSTSHWSKKGRKALFCWAAGALPTPLRAGRICQVVKVHKILLAILCILYIDFSPDI